ncbi:MAG TPA: redoxin domain-containing protein [Candidatus Limnocylindrales bacterium]|jgi:peroxiredoxin
MRLPELLGALGALVVGTVLAVFLLTSALGEQPALPTPVPPTLPALPTAVAEASPSQPPGVVTGTPTAPLATGQPAPPLEVTLLDGSIMNTSDFAGVPMWVYFTTTWTPQTPAELSLIEDYAKQLGQEMNVLVVDVGEDQQTVQSFMKQQKFNNIPVAVDQDGAAQESFGAFGLPVSYFIGADGTVQGVVYGGAPADIYIQAITDLVPDFSAEAPTRAPVIVPSESPAPEETASAGQ